jgi:hypothetical protein
LRWQTAQTVLSVFLVFCFRLYALAQASSPHKRLEIELSALRRPIDIVKPRTRTEAAWMGGCFLDGCVAPNSCSALELPDGVNIQVLHE